ncbi:MAG: hypothetical protein RLZZ241_2212 [Bacteroidota bacterium]|jgi:hypothetical protein
MLNNSSFTGLLRFLALLLCQVLIFNNLNVFGLYNPMLYVLFLYWYPIKNNRALFLSVSFLLGFAVDVFSDTLALHTAAMLTTAFFRPQIMAFVFGINMEFQNLRITQTSRLQQLSFLAILLSLHHLVFFALEIFSLTNFLLILKMSLITGTLSFIFSALFASLFSSR